MFGQNPVAKAADYPAGGHRLRVVGQPFYTLQGEGLLAGAPAIFVRLHGCNLRCWFCDTEFSNPDDPWVEVEQLLALIAQCGNAGPRELGATWRHPLVVITGGEPLLQNLGPLIRWLLGMGFPVQVETAGSIYQELPEETLVCLSPKTPRIREEWYQRDPARTFWKYPVRAGSLPINGPQDDTQRKGQAGKRAGPGPGLVYIIPMDEGDPEANAANLAAATSFVLARGGRYRLGLQLHKVTGLP